MTYIDRQVAVLSGYYRLKGFRHELPKKIARKCRPKSDCMNVLIMVILRIETRMWLKTQIAVFPEWLMLKNQTK